MCLTQGLDIWILRDGEWDGGESGRGNPVGPRVLPSAGPQVTRRLSASVRAARTVHVLRVKITGNRMRGRQGWCCLLGMDITLSPVDVSDMPEVDRALRSWQVEGEPLQLHPGDVGWGCRLGVGPTVAALRAWRASASPGSGSSASASPGSAAAGRLLAVGFLDEPDLLRLALAPDVVGDEAVAQVLAAYVTDPGQGVLPVGESVMEAPVGAAIHEALAALGWDVDEPWTPLRRDLSTPVEDPGVRVEVVEVVEAGASGMAAPEAAGRQDWSSVLRAAFGNISSLDDSEMRRRWDAMHEGPAARDSRSLVAYDDAGAAVAAATVWAAGPGRPGVLEPVGVHPDHRGHGHGRAISLAAARALQELGSSSALVCTPSSNVAAVATYASAGFAREPERRDRRRAG